MSLSWYLNRLRSMSVPEMSARVGERLKKDAARGRREGWDRFGAPGGAPVLPGLRAAIVARAAEVAPLAKSQSEEFLGGSFAALGVDWPKTAGLPKFSAEVWRLDPVTGGHWPGAG